MQKKLLVISVKKITRRSEEGKGRGEKREEKSGKEP